MTQLEPIIIPTDDQPITIERGTFPDPEEAQEFFDEIGFGDTEEPT